jgi:hypothetical protein
MASKDEQRDREMEGWEDGWRREGGRMVDRKEGR